MFRRYSDTGQMQEDVIGLRDETIPGMSALLVPFMKNGKRLDSQASLDDIRRQTASQLSSLPPRLKALEGTPSYTVTLSEQLVDLQNKLVGELGRQTRKGTFASRGTP